MLNFFNRFLGRDLESKFQKYLNYRKELNVLETEAKVLARDYEENKSMLGISPEESGLSKSVIGEKFSSWLKSYTKEVESLCKRRDSILKSMDLLMCDDLSKKLEEHDQYFTLKKSYKEGRIGRKLFNNVLKAKNKKVHYSDVIVYNEEGKILILHRTNSDKDLEGGEWCLPGGHVDYGESHDEAALRELFEETNIKADQADLVIKKETEDAVINYYAVRLKEVPLVVLDSNEHDGSKWVDPYIGFKDSEFIYDLGETLNEYFTPNYGDPIVIKKGLIEDLLNGKLNREEFLSKCKDLEKSMTAGETVLEKESLENEVTETNVPEPKNTEDVNAEEIELEKSNDGSYNISIELKDEKSRDLLYDVLNHIKEIGNGGHSFKIEIDRGDSDYEKEFHWDGDGGNMISDLSKFQVKGSINKSASTEEEVDKDNKKNELDGGYADKMTVKQIAEKHDVSEEQILDQVNVGKGVELEHTDSEEKAIEIAMDHLYENPNYYTDLAEMEANAEKREKEKESGD